MKFFIIAALLCCSSYAYSSCVILLHGLARTEGSMKKIEKTLSDHGYTSVNLGYPSRQYEIEILAQKAIVPALKACQNEVEINVVTHSLGGILIRQYLSEYEIPNLKSVVMLGPPNKGSEVVDKLRGLLGFHLINGDAGLQLGTNETSIPRSLGRANFNLGIIAGNKSINWFLSTLIPGEDDGKVSIESTKLEGMNDHIIMPVMHPFMMKDDKVISQIIYYLQHGHFEKDSR